MKSTGTETDVAVFARHGEATSGDILAAYQDYCDSHVAAASAIDTQRAIRRLAATWRTAFPAQIDEYLELTRQLLAVWKSSVGCARSGNERMFHTTGSTRNGSRHYPFGPYPDLWIQTIWELTRYPLGPRIIVKLDPVSNPYAELTVTSSPTAIYQYIIQCGPLCQSRVGELVATLQSLLARHAMISLISVPDTFLYLNRQPEFQVFAIDHRDRINLMSQHWEPFYARRHLEERRVHINDALGDWTSGLFFSTCHAGFRHTLPTCAATPHGRINLLNLIWAPDAEFGQGGDLFEPISISPCPCGLNRLEFRFLPHEATALQTPHGERVYELELAERLESSFVSIQFIQEGKILYIRYQLEGPMLDADLLEDYFRAHDFDVVFQPNDCYTVGNKRPVFYRYSS